MALNTKAEITNLGARMVANVAFVPLAVQAGIVATIKSLVGLAKDEISLVILLKQSLWDDNQPLAEAINTGTLGAILKYMALIGESVVFDVDLPDMLDMDGPASVSAGRDGGLATQVNVGFSTPPEGFECQIFLDGVYVKTSTQTGSPTVWDAIQGVLAGGHNLRFIYRRVEDGAMSRFSAIVNIA
jgi:hypothetical protein